MVLWYKKEKGFNAAGSFFRWDRGVAIHWADCAKGQCSVINTHMHHVTVSSELLLLPGVVESLSLLGACSGAVLLQHVSPHVPS